jgi:hypothetical protein
VGSNSRSCVNVSFRCSKWRYLSPGQLPRLWRRRGLPAIAVTDPGWTAGKMVADDWLGTFALQFDQRPIENFPESIEEFEGGDLLREKPSCAGFE